MYCYKGKPFPLGWHFLVNPKLEKLVLTTLYFLWSASEFDVGLQRRNVPCSNFPFFLFFYCRVENELKGTFKSIKTDLV